MTPRAARKLAPTIIDVHMGPEGVLAVLGWASAGFFYVDERREFTRAEWEELRKWAFS